MAALIGRRPEEEGDGALAQHVVLVLVLPQRSPLLCFQYFDWLPIPSKQKEPC